MRYSEIIESYGLKSFDIRNIDIEDAQRHFDLPIEDQFSSKQALRRGLSDTKKSLLRLFGIGPIRVYRAMTVSAEFIDNLSDVDGVGCSWSWSVEGALKGSGLAHSTIPAGERGIVLVATVSQEDVNWAFTIACQTFHEDEQEIVIDDGVALELSEIMFVDSGRVVRKITSPSQTIRT